MSDRPTLQEIADMPFPASEQALQEHYGVEPYREKVPGEAPFWTIRVDYSYITSHTDDVSYEVQAESLDEAREIAEDMCRDENRILEEFEIEDSRATKEPPDDR